MHLRRALLGRPGSKGAPPLTSQPTMIANQEISP
jgi:hypothetical protein